MTEPMSGTAVPTSSRLSRVSSVAIQLAQREDLTDVVFAWADEFFVGIGDINAAFLPKKKELVPPPVVPLASPPLTAEISPAAEGSASPLDSAVSSGGETSPGRGERSTTPLTSPSPGPGPSLSPLHPSASPSTCSAAAAEAAEAAVHHLHLPDEILSEPTRISDLVVSSSPEEVVSPSLKEASEHAKETIHYLIEARPLEKARREADALHHLNHPPSPKSPSRSPLPPLPVSSTEDKSAPDVAQKTSPAALPPSVEADSALVPVGEETDDDDDDYEEQPVLRDDDRELDRLFDVSGLLPRRPFAPAEHHRLTIAGCPNPDQILSSVRARFYQEHESRGASDVAVRD